jgi:nucleoside-diphosphate-sugar epimerase
MRILLTGASSFTGASFARELAAAGHHVVACFRNAQGSYEGTRSARIAGLDRLIEPIWSLTFGDERFLELVATRDFDILLHHAAEVANYRSWDFDPIAATSANTRNAREILTRMASRGCRRLVITGSVFEPYEGVGDAEHRAFSPYGLSKHMTFELFRLEAERLGLSLGKFIITNPFGPREEIRFTSYLAREWSAGRTPTVNTPAYLRDNIHVSLLALAYRSFSESLPEVAGVVRFDPSGYVETQGDFARRVAREIGKRSGKPCQVIDAIQKEFDEPVFRVNTRSAALEHPEWSEDAAWDLLAEYYQETFGL